MTEHDARIVVANASFGTPFLSVPMCAYNRAMTNTTNRPAAANRAIDAFANGHRRIRQAAGLHCPAQIVASLGCDDYTFEYLADNQWRLVATATYGNGSFVYGPGCDASGWVVPAALGAALTAAVEDAAK